MGETQVQKPRSVDFIWGSNDTPLPPAEERDAVTPSVLACTPGLGLADIALGGFKAGFFLRHSIKLCSSDSTRLAQATGTADACYC